MPGGTTKGRHTFKIALLAGCRRCAHAIDARRSLHGAAAWTTQHDCKRTADASRWRTNSLVELTPSARLTHAG